MFRKVGFFHFGRCHEHPIESLRLALIAEEDVGGALLVLPEGFNIRKYYRDETRKCDYGRGILRELQSCSEEFKITFVVGLIIQETWPASVLSWGRPPYSSARLIVPGCDPWLLCYKSQRDGSGNYTDCVDGCDNENPAPCSGDWVGALLCRDASDAPQRCIALQDGFAKWSTGGRFACIPACMNSDFFRGGEVGADAKLRPDSRDTVVILANSDPKGCKSFISNSAGRIIRNILDQDQHENKVVLESLATTLAA